MKPISIEQIHAAPILVVDDEPANVRLLERILAQNGFTCVYVTTDSREATPLYLLHKPDLVLLDLNMPHKSGFDVLKEMRALEPAYLPVIVLTAYTDREIRILALKSGAKDYLVKPIDNTEVISRINNILEVSLLFKLVREQNETLETRVRERTEDLQREIQEREKVEAEKLFVLSHDPVTKLLNFSALYSQIELLGSYAPDGLFQALLVLSLDRFNDINKSMGHQHGDYLLERISQQIQKILRRYKDPMLLQQLRGDTVARYAGGKFAIFLRFLRDREQLSQIIQRLLTAIAQPVEVDQLLLETQATVGVAIYPEHGATPRLLIRHAEMALQAARDLRRPVMIYSEDIDTYSPKKLALMADLRRAIDDQQLHVFYQPIVDIRTFRVKGIEALARWEHRIDGAINPTDFIQTAEKSGLIKSMTSWVIRRAVEDRMALGAWAEGLTLSVNMSAYCLWDNELVECVDKILTEHQMPAELLTLEITESAMMENPDRALAVLNRLHDLGVKLSIDDFGTGFSNLAYLKHLPVDELKIDRVFVKDMDQDPKCHTIVEAMISMGHHFGLKVVAEGAEELQIVQRLVQCDCDMIQGNYFSVPRSASDVSRWIREQNSLSLN